MIPRDIETTEQWQVRWEAPGGAEITRTGTEAQVRYMAQQRAAFQPIVEKRTITVGPWVDPDACPHPHCDYDPAVDGQHRHGYDADE